MLQPPSLFWPVRFIIRAVLTIVCVVAFSEVIWGTFWLALAVSSAVCFYASYVSLEAKPPTMKGPS
jgi:hypothetical protein